MVWAKNYIYKIYGNPDPTLMEVIFSKLARFNKFKGPGIDIEDIDFNVGEVSLDDVADDKVLQTNLRTNAFNLLTYFEKIFYENTGGNKFLLILDQLDENWLSGEIEEYSKILINLINVCRNISNDPNTSKSIKIIPFLRTDIYDSLRFNDKNKLLQDSAITIAWDNDSLNDMFFERIKKFKPNDLDLELEKKCGCVFEVSFVQQGTPPFKFITRRSFFRPRDVIVYFNKIRKLHEQSKKGLYSSSDLYAADAEASASIYNEIIDEWSNQFPNIERLLSILQIINIQSFKYDEFKNKYEKEFNNASEGDVRRDLKFLFENSIIGQKKQGRWEYISSLPNLKLNIENDFRTHQALKYRLQLKESRPNQAD